MSLVDKSNADPNKPPGYDDCLSVIDLRPHRRKDKSRAPGNMFPPTPSLPIQPENRHVEPPNMSPHFGPGAGPQMNPAYINMLKTPPVQVQPAMYQQSPLSPTAQDVEVIRRANILLDAVKNVWGDSSSEADSSDEEEAAAPTSESFDYVSTFEKTNAPINAAPIVLPSVEEQQTPNSPHAPICLAPPAAARPPRQGHIMQFDKNAGKLPTPPSEPSPTQIPSVPDPPPRQSPATSNPGIPRYLPSPYPVLASKPSKSRNFSLHPPHPTAFPPPTMGDFKPVNGHGAAYLSSNHTQQPYYFVPPTGDPKDQRYSQSSALPTNGPAVISLPPALPKTGTNGSAVPRIPSSQHQAPTIPPKNGTVVRLSDPGPAKEHPMWKPPKNGTLIDFGKTTKPFQSGSRKRKG
ncbi:hypothetical protein E6O75_ATG08966 [Venturia nashicola]|uniref:Uncharacterized protein n=1 Tax=Venturia nashicola TaxID=86259 RepID=A0A4Z1P2R7_9PEZI|nr:hypothetical protein E6O75_ATG08966 [Venturia nashicola]